MAVVMSAEAWKARRVIAEASYWPGSRVDSVVVAEGILSGKGSSLPDGGCASEAMKIYAREGSLEEQLGKMKFALWVQTLVRPVIP